MDTYPEITINCHSSIRIAGSKTIYFDPFHIASAPHDADVIFVTHDHFDHLSEEDVEKVRNEKTVVVTHENADRISVEGLSFTAVPAYNVNKKFHPREAHYVGYLVTMDGKRYYVTGDTDATEEMKRVSADVVLMPVGGTYTMTAEEAADAAAEMDVTTVIPTHYGEIVGEKNDGERFKALVNGRKNVVLKLFQS